MARRQRHRSRRQYRTGSTLQRFLGEPRRWAIAPISFIHAISYNSDLTHYTLKEAPPPRICYEIANRYPNLGQQSVIHTFNKELDHFIAEDENICSFESWMLGE